MNTLQQALEQLRKKAYVDQKMLALFAEKAENENFVREESPTEHFISMFLPLNKKDNRVFLGHHILANDWIPPGGHIEKGENPRDTVLREFNEELRYKNNKENIELFDLSIIQVRNPLRPCKFHYDFWYRVEVNEQPFQFDKREFYDGRWFNLKDALQITKRPEYKAVVEKLSTALSL